MEGRSTRVIGALKFGSQVTLTVARPDRYIRVDTLLLQGVSAETAIGFRDGTLLQWTRGPGGTQSTPADQIPANAREGATRAAAGQQRRELRQLLLGGLAGPFDSTVMAVDSLGVAEAPDGSADAFRVAFADGSSARLFADTVTHLPLMVSWEAADPLAPVRAAGAPSGRSSAPADPPAVEHRFYFASYQTTGKLRWPFVVSRAVAGTLVEELRFDRVLINSPVDHRVFDPGSVTP
jgi:hypothetical protein